MTDQKQAQSSSAGLRDVLLRLAAGVEVHRVQDGVDELLMRGPLLAFAPVDKDGLEGAAVLVEVGEGATGTSWEMVVGVTPTLKVAPLTYMIGLGEVFLSVTLSEDTEPEAVGAWEGLLEAATVYKESEALLADPAVVQGDFLLADALAFDNLYAKKIHDTSSRIAGGILMASHSISSKLAAQGEALKARAHPQAEPMKVPSAVMGAAGTAEGGARFVAKAADRVVGAVVAVPFAVASGAVRMFGRTKAAEEGAGDQPQKAHKQIGYAAAVGFAQVYESMEAGARLVLCGARDTTAQVVAHKYGEDAGQVTKSSLSTTGHLASAYTAVRRIGVRAVARKTAKTTAKKVLISYVKPATIGPQASSTKQVAKNLVAQHKDSIINGQGASATAPSTGTSAMDPAVSPHHAMLQQSHSQRLATGAPSTAQPQPGLQAA